MKIAILGTGFPAMIVAHAVEDHFKNEDHEIVMYGPNLRPVSAGARFYERQIPGVEARQAMCETQSAGDADDYAEKVGGPITEYNRPRPDFLAFSSNDASKQLWERYNHHIIQLPLDKDLIRSSTWDDCDYVLSTIPRPMWYSRQESHLFAATRHWRLDECHEGPEAIGSPYSLGKPYDRNLMIFDSTEDSSFFKITQLFGLMTVEWGFHKKPPISDAYLEILPLATPPGMGLRDVVPNWQGTMALAHLGPVARWRASSDLGAVYFDTKKVLEGDYGDNSSGRHN